MKSLHDKAIVWAVATALTMPMPVGVMAQSAGSATQGTSTQGTAPAQTVAEAPLRQEELEQLLAPIALYPDSLLAQVLMASTYPLEIVQAARWLKANPKVTGKALEEAMQKQRWDPSVKSLTAMPQVLEMMDARIDWTQKVGDAFLAQQAQVMQTVQALRAKASAAGNLKSTPEQQVSTVQEGGQSVIVIEPANPQVVYVPTYDPAVVYGAWPYPAYPPYYYYPPAYYPGAGMFWFGAGMLVGAAIWGGCNWGGGGVYINHHNYNNFNRSNIGGDSNWRHNVDHRKGVAYRDQATARQYNRDFSRDAQAREQFRGRGEGGRQATPRGDAARDPGGSAGGRDGAGSSRDGASARTMDRGGASRDFSGGRSGGFDGVGNGAGTRDISSRGNASRQSMGGGSSGGFSRGGGGGGGRGGGWRR
jgi:uncharacterized membrane protein YgcG